MSDHPFPLWKLKAACRHAPPGMFFPDAGEKPADALAMCQACPVIAECAEAGRDEPVGIWGGVIASERSRRPTCGTAHGRDAHYRRREAVCDACKAANHAYVASKRAAS